MYPKLNIFLPLECPITKLAFLCKNNYGYKERSKVQRALNLL